MWRNRYTTFFDNDFVMLNSTDSTIGKMFQKTGSYLKKYEKIATFFLVNLRKGKNYYID